MSVWTPILFFEGEDPEALKEAFCVMCARYGDQFTHFEVATHVFTNLRDPLARSQQAAEAWWKDLSVHERISEIRSMGTVEEEVPAAVLKSMAKQIALNPREQAKDRLTAMRLIAEMQGMVFKPIEVKVPVSAEEDKPKGFRFVPYEDDEEEIAVSNSNAA